MGYSGTGKSNVSCTSLSCKFLAKIYVQFVNKLTGNKEEKTASRLGSRTQDIREFTTITNKGRYVFIDTPGFDNDSSFDADILRIIADWLEAR